ncbi:MAG: N-acetylmuramoyl-L-alanine amidase family protein [Ignavibacteria bacterium]
MRNWTYKIYLLLIFMIILSTCYSKEKLDVIVLDAGHGGKDPGTIGLSVVKEKDINLAVALKLGELIKGTYPEIKIIYIRDRDEYIEVKERTITANKSKAKLFISIHANHKKQEETEKNGFEIYVLNRERFPEAVEITLKENSVLQYQQSGNDTTDKFIFSSLARNSYLVHSQILCSMLELNLISSTELASRGIFQSGFWVLLGASMPSVLIECGYLSDANDEKYLSSEIGQNNIARALLNAFVRYKMIYEME